MLLAAKQKPDPEILQILIEKAQKYNRALFILGTLHEQGRGIAKDKSKALEYYKMAVAQGNKEAQKALDRLQH